MRRRYRIDREIARAILKYGVPELPSNQTSVRLFETGQSQGLEPWRIHAVGVTLAAGFTSLFLAIVTSGVQLLESRNWNHHWERWDLIRAGIALGLFVISIANFIKLIRTLRRLAHAAYLVPAVVIGIGRRNQSFGVPVVFIAEVSGAIRLVPMWVLRKFSGNFREGLVTALIVEPLTRKNRYHFNPKLSDAALSRGDEFLSR